MVSHVLPETIPPCWTLPKDDNAHDNDHMMTDVADRESQSLSSSPMSHLPLRLSSSNPHACPTASLWNNGGIKHPLAHGHVSFCAPRSPHPFSLPAECPDASSYAAVAPSATLASSTLAVLLAGAGMNTVWCRKTAHGRASAYARRY